MDVNFKIWGKKGDFPEEVLIALGIFGLNDKYVFKNVKGTHYPKKLSVKTN